MKFKHFISTGLHNLALTPVGDFLGFPRSGRQLFLGPLQDFLITTHESIGRADYLRVEPISLSASFAVPRVPPYHLVFPGFEFVFAIAVAFLDCPFELVVVPFDLSQIFIGKLSPLTFELSLKLIHLPLNVSAFMSSSSLVITKCVYVQHAYLFLNA